MGKVTIHTFCRSGFFLGASDAAVELAMSKMELLVGSTVAAVGHTLRRLLQLGLLLYSLPLLSTHLFLRIKLPCKHRGE